MLSADVRGIAVCNRLMCRRFAAVENTRALFSQRTQKIITEGSNDCGYNSKVVQNPFKGAFFHATRRTKKRRSQ